MIFLSFKCFGKWYVEEMLWTNLVVGILSWTCKTKLRTELVKKINLKKYIFAMYMHTNCINLRNSINWFSSLAAPLEAQFTLNNSDYLPLQLQIFWFFVFLFADSLVSCLCLLHVARFLPTHLLFVLLASHPCFRLRQTLHIRNLLEPVVDCWND